MGCKGAGGNGSAGDSLQAELEDLLRRVEFYKRKLVHDKKAQQGGATSKDEAEVQA